jgi:hypothetical protein
VVEERVRIYDPRITIFVRERSLSADFVVERIDPEGLPRSRRDLWRAASPPFAQLLPRTLQRESCAPFAEEGRPDSARGACLCCQAWAGFTIATFEFENPTGTAHEICAARGVTRSASAMSLETRGRSNTRSISAGSLELVRRPWTLRSSRDAPSRAISSLAKIRFSGHLALACRSLSFGI